VNQTFSQEVDTVKNINIEFITDQLENIAQSTDMKLDYTDLIDNYRYYSKNPVNINGYDVKILRDLYLITDIQLNNLVLYRNQFGLIYSIYELKLITGFDEETIKRLRLFIEFGTKDTRKSYGFKDIFKYGKHSIIARADRIIEKKNGFLMHSDSALKYPGSIYIGDPQHLYLRYSYNFKNKVRFGLTLDKDAGEILIKNRLSDTLQKIIGSNTGYGYDFLSVFAYAESKGILKKIIIGDYHLEFGQGLTLWSGLSFGKSAEAITIRKFGRGISPNTSANENRYFRGSAATLGIKNFTLTTFFSKNKVDGNLVISNDTLQQHISSIIETGMHRTINELMDKNTFEIQILGGNLTFTNKRTKIGLTAVNTKFSKPISQSDELYKLYNFSGNTLNNYGFDYAINLNKINLFGEIATASTGGIAFVSGINTLLSERFYLTLLYHNYNRKYRNFYNNPFAESGSISNEAGIYIGFKALLNNNIHITGYIDQYSFPWLKYRVSSTSIGSDYLIQLNYNPKNDIVMYLRFRHKNKQEDIAIARNYLRTVEDITRNELRFFISYSTPYNITLKNRMDFVSCNKPGAPVDFGYLLYQDILYRPPSFPIDATFRYALFSTDSYDSRIYTYENDVLYAFSVPSYFYTGQRWYLMLKLRIGNRVAIWLRYARTTYFNKRSIGSGNDLINKNHKSEVKVELKIKF